MTRKLLLVCFICLLATPAVADTTSPTSGLWSNINTVVLIFTLLLGVAGFIRSIEQNKDSSFRDITSRLCERDSPVVRAGAAGQLPNYFRYRRYYVFWRPYPSQVLHLLLHALKKEEDLDVRQVLFNSLVLITGNRSLRAVAQSAGTDLGRGIDLVRAKLDQLIMDGFDFSGIDLIEASLTKSSLIRARFVGANLLTRTWRRPILLTPNCGTQSLSTLICRKQNSSPGAITSMPIPRYTRRICWAPNGLRQSIHARWVPADSDLARRAAQILSKE